MSKTHSGAHRRSIQKTRGGKGYPEKLAAQIEIALAEAYGDGRISLDEAAFPWAVTWDVEFDFDGTLSTEEGASAALARELSPAA